MAGRRAALRMGRKKGRGKPLKIIILHMLRGA